MLWLELAIAASILSIGRYLFYSFVRKDVFWIVALRYGGFLGITVISHYTLGSAWTFGWLVGFPLLGLLVHYLFIKKHGFRFFKPGDN
ncbi:hypothetical protein EBB07_22245 [Paenibacillaceae bacterium]|nr:hypothetical protein EBB07_22245 [Paenibacillaceae bacterium]